MSDEIREAHYEGMFVFPQAQTSDISGAVSHIKEIISKGKGELIAIKKWDERRLAYPIKKHNRGLFILTYFKAPTSTLMGIERDCNLSEVMIRSLVTRADHLTEDEMRAADGLAELEAEAKMREETAAEESSTPPAPPSPPVPPTSAEPAPVEADVPSAAEEAVATATGDDESSKEPAAE
ncbi:MAG: 30S ribosomal protein S6 [Phycisphaerales bacterium]|nr:30S ribosomal protein S6 [Phycisphaerales bacterium]